MNKQPRIVILDYGAGNVFSVKNALAALGHDAILTDDCDVIRTADKIILPGVGSANQAMSALKEKELTEVIINCKVPFLGICLGMQLLGAFSHEGHVDTLRIFDFETLKFEADKVPRIPHMGWSTVSVVEHPLWEGIPNDAYYYFVHSYYVPIVEETIGYGTYKEPFSAAISDKHFHAVQFHPEKSGKYGLQFLRNFIENI